MFHFVFALSTFIWVWKTLKAFFYYYYFGNKYFRYPIILVVSYVIFYLLFFVFFFKFGSIFTYYSQIETCTLSKVIIWNLPRTTIIFNNTLIRDFSRISTSFCIILYNFCTFLIFLSSSAPSQKYHDERFTLRWFFKSISKRRILSFELICTNSVLLIYIDNFYCICFFKAAFIWKRKFSGCWYEFYFLIGGELSSLGTSAMYSDGCSGG